MAEAGSTGAGDYLLRRSLLKRSLLRRRFLRRSLLSYFLLPLILSSRNLYVFTLSVLYLSQRAQNEWDDRSHIQSEEGMD